MFSPLFLAMNKEKKEEDMLDSWWNINNTAF
jgi:hypothetical protein